MCKLKSVDCDILKYWYIRIALLKQLVAYLKTNSMLIACGPAARKQSYIY